MYQLGRLFGPLIAVPLLALVLWWPPPTIVIIAGILLILGSVAGIVLGVGLRLDVEPAAVWVRSPLGTKEFPASESSARTESMASFFGFRRFAFLVLERRGAIRYSARIPLSEFSAAERQRIVEVARATLGKA
jgi:hypothetical protein